VTSQCKIEDCTRSAWAGGLCVKHFRAKYELEVKIEEKCCALANDRGYLAWKFNSTGRSGVPDRIFIGDGRVFFVEFKKKKQKARDKQVATIDLMKAHGAEVYVIDSLEAFKRIC